MNLSHSQLSSFCKYLYNFEKKNWNEHAQVNNYGLFIEAMKLKTQIS